MKLKVKKSYAEQLQDIIEQYRRAHPDVVQLRMREVASWAMANGLMHPSRRDAISLCAHDLARAASQEYYTDAQGRRVRKKHAVRQLIEEEGKPKQLVLWADITNAPPEHMHMSLQQRRTGIVGDCKQLKTDLDSYNDNNVHGAEIQMSFDFSEDLQELDMPTEYNPEVDA